MIEYTLHGSTEKVLKSKIDDYLYMYHPFGYGTFVKEKYQKEDGTFVAVMCRSESCD